MKSLTETMIKSFQEEVNLSSFTKIAAIIILTPFFLMIDVFYFLLPLLFKLLGFIAGGGKEK